jgi:hypothetical protein
VCICLPENSYAQQKILQCGLYAGQLQRRFRISKPSLRLLRYRTAFARPISRAAPVTSATRLAADLGIASSLRKHDLRLSAKAVHFEIAFSASAWNGYRVQSRGTRCQRRIESSLSRNTFGSQSLRDRYTGPNGISAHTPVRGLVVMGPRPGRIVEVINLDLPHPRRLDKLRRRVVRATLRALVHPDLRRQPTCGERQPYFNPPYARLKFV